MSSSGGGDINQHNPFNLSRFLEAQESMYTIALSELRAGQKLTHWMWFIFPQLDGLGASKTSNYYSIKCMEESRKYLEHPVLGTRLLDCTKYAIAIQGRTIRQIFGTPDNMKFCSSMTLFEHVAAPNSVFSYALDKYFAGKRDAETLRLIREPNAKRTSSDSVTGAAG